MGDVKRVLITGATGFVGRATVATARDAGLKVVTVARSGADHAIDLGAQDAKAQLVQAMADCDAVIHLAAAMSGDAEAHRHLTIGGTQNLLAAMAEAGVGHLTLASSIAVFDTGQIPVGDDLTDATALENPAMSRDTYSGAKVRQEQLTRTARLDSLSIVRPGIVYDDEHLWNAHLGVGLGPVLVRIGDADSPLPMCHVSNCAKALVQATTGRMDDSFVALDRELPTRGQVIGAMKKQGWPKLVVPLPWQLLWAFAQATRPIAAKLPGLLRSDVLRQRALPMGFDLRDPFDDALPRRASLWEGAA